MNNSDGAGPESSEASATPALTAGGTLSTLTLSGVALTPAFTPATRDYRASVGGSVAQVTVTATPTRGTAAITPADDDTAAGHQVDLPVGTTTITVTVTDGSASGVYTIRVTRAASPPGTDTTLSALVLSDGTLTPSFDPAIRDYTTTVDGSVSQMTVTAAANKSGATVAVTPADANTDAGHQVDLGVGTTAITVTVTDSSVTGAYTIGVTRTGSVPAAPTDLTATGDGDVVLSWTAPASNGLAISSYDYQQKAGGADAYGRWTPIPGSGPATRSYTVTGLTSGTTYAFKVRAVNDAGPGEASNEATALGRLVWARTEMEVADAITAARNEAFGADRRFTPGDEAIEVMGEALFEAADGVRVLYSASTTDADVASASVSGGEVTVTAEATGTADITITANAIPPAGVEILEQTNPREASILFTVDVGFEALTIELSAPSAETNLVEGGRTHANGTLGTVTVTATANRPLTNETTVMLRRDRTASTAGDDDFTAGSIVIAVGPDHGLDGGDGRRGRHAGGPGRAGAVRRGRQQCGRGHGRNQALPLGCRGAGPAAHRAASAGGLPGHRRIPPVSAAVAFGVGVRNSPLPPLPRSPGGEGAFSCALAVGGSVGRWRSRGASQHTPPIPDRSRATSTSCGARWKGCSQGESPRRRRASAVSLSGCGWRA